MPLDAESLFDKYTSLLLSYNEVMNLTAITEVEEIKIKHYLDCLSPLAFSLIPDGAKVADVGSGAGFPGLPLKIGKRNIHLTAIDSLNKRINFLKTVGEELSLADFECIHMRAEEAGQDKALRESFDIATARAVAPLSVLSEWCLPLVKVGGAFVALKGPSPEEEIEEAKAAIAVLGGEVSKVYEVNLPGNITHSIVYIKKISQTPQKYPRKAGKASKQPIK
ncbi:MAG: 16S rRNA (guanine(527)-N(7))-methyltransferase RsmG [Clostridia bacterium]|nr:16S rRNA (guanine(527)-N(7))-methyltransferase RsmG [Clostridia bacterium]